MELKGKKALVIGLARTGRECARFLTQQGAKVWISDLRGAAELGQEMAALADLSLSYHLGGEKKIGSMAWTTSCRARRAHGNSSLREAVAEKDSRAQRNRAGLPPLRRAASGDHRHQRQKHDDNIDRQDACGRRQESFSRRQLGRALSARWRILGIGVWSRSAAFSWNRLQQFRPRIALCLMSPKTTWTATRVSPTIARPRSASSRPSKDTDVAILNRDDPLVWALRRRIAARIVSFGFSEVAEGLCATPTEVIWRDGADEQRFSLTKAKIQGAT